MQKNQTTRQIAFELDLADKTVIDYKYKIRKKLNIKIQKKPTKTFNGIYKQKRTTPIVVRPAKHAVKKNCVTYYAHNRKLYYNNCYYNLDVMFNFLKSRKDSVNKIVDSASKQDVTEYILCQWIKLSANINDMKQRINEVEVYLNDIRKDTSAHKSSSQGN
jgi:hypothetical protein